MKKIYFTGIVMLLLAGLFMFACQNDVETTEGDFDRSVSSEICKTNKNTGVYDDNIGKSWDAWEEARTHFFIEYYEYTSGLGYTYTKQKWTDDFGGVFIDENGIFNILIVGNRMPVKSDYLIYKKVNNSYNFLDSIQEEISETMDMFNIWQVGICERCNKVLVCLENEKEINSLINYLKAKNLFKPNTLKIYVEKHEWNFAYTLKYNSNITYRDNIEIYENVILGESPYFEFYYDNPKYFSNIIIFESEEELIGLNIEENFFNNNMLGMIFVPWGGGLQLRDSNIYNENGNLAFSIDIWSWSGISTDEARLDIFFLKIPKY